MIRIAVVSMLAVAPARRACLSLVLTRPCFRANTSPSLPLAYGGCAPPDALGTSACTAPRAARACHLFSLALFSREFFAFSATYTFHALAMGSSWHLERDENQRLHSVGTLCFSAYLYVNRWTRTLHLPPLRLRCSLFRLGAHRLVSRFRALSSFWCVIERCLVVAPSCQTVGSGSRGL